MIAMAVNSLLCDAMRNFVVGVIGQLRVDISEPEALGPDEFLIAHDADDDAGESSIRNLSFHPRRKQPLCAENVGVASDRSRGRWQAVPLWWMRAGIGRGAREGDDGDAASASGVREDGSQAMHGASV